MENIDEAGLTEKKMNKTRSCNTQIRRSEPPKRFSFEGNEAVKSLDLALGRLKKSKLVNGEGRQTCSGEEASDLFMDIRPRPYGNDNTSLMSMNFSHYELVRNLSRSNCNSDGAYSGNTCSARLTATDLNLKDEHLERYFQSMEMWSRNYREGGPSQMQVDIPEN